MIALKNVRTHRFLTTCSSIIAAKMTVDDRFIIMNQLGEGAFGQVYKAINKSTDEIVAIKMPKRHMGKRELEKESIILQKLSHDNVVRSLGNSITSSGHICLILEFINSDLSREIESGPLTFSKVKSFAIQILLGVQYLHENFIMHRDLKPDNCLVSSKGVLKIADFGVSKSFKCRGPNLPGPHTNGVGFWSYTPPEVLFGATDYGRSVDMWAVGCIFAEMFLDGPLFNSEGNRFVDLNLIFILRGTPDEESWPGLAELPYGRFSFKKHAPMHFCKVVPKAPADMLDVLTRLLEVFPPRRARCPETLRMPYFYNSPMPFLRSLVKKLPPPNK